MSSTTKRIVIIEDESAHFELLERSVRKTAPDVEVEWHQSAESWMQTFDSSTPPDVLITDYMMSGMDGVELVELLNKRAVDFPIIVTTGQGSEKTAVRAMKLGAFDYVIKSTDFMDMMPEIIRRALKESELRAAYRRAREDVEESRRLTNLLINSLPHPAMLVRNDGAVVAANSAAVVGGYVVGDNPELSNLAPLPDEVRVDRRIVHREVEENDRHHDVWWMPVDDRLNLHYLIDITERRTAEKKILETEKQYRRLLEEAPFAVAIIQSGKAVFLNRKACEISNCIDENIHEWEKISTAQTSADADDAEGLHRISDTAVDMELSARDNQGADIYLHCTIMNVIYKNGPARLCFFHDITQNIEIELDREKFEREIVVLSDEVKALRSELRKSVRNIHHNSDGMAQVIEMADRVARSTAPVLIYGETGTGKELLASAIHHNTFNPRKEKPFLIINCGAISENLIESELFGHVRGAFTDAKTDKHGYFEAADGGTVFLDEISAAPLSLQVKLLRILDSGEYMRVGEASVRRVNVRFIAATNVPLDELVGKGAFREDLFHRLNTVQINIPPLRDRRTDIPVLIRHFIEHFAADTGKTLRIDKDALDALYSHYWPGNVRELKHTIQNLAIMSATGRITAADVPKHIAGRETFNRSLPFVELKKEIVRDFEKVYFRNLVELADGNLSRASRLAKMNRKYLMLKIEEHGIEPKRFRAAGKASPIDAEDEE